MILLLPLTRKKRTLFSTVLYYRENTNSLTKTFSSLLLKSCDAFEN